MWENISVSTKIHKIHKIIKRLTANNRLLINKNALVVLLTKQILPLVSHYMMYLKLSGQFLTHYVKQLKITEKKIPL